MPIYTRLQTKGGHRVTYQLSKLKEDSDPHVSPSSLFSAAAARIPGHWLQLLLSRLLSLSEMPKHFFYAWDCS